MTRASARWQNQAGHAGSVLIWIGFYSGSAPVRILHAFRKLDKRKRRLPIQRSSQDAVEVAEEAGLRYVSDDQPGYTRKAKSDDPEYFDAEGKPIRDEQRLLRMKRL
jgi:hypothetical protein